MPKLKRTEAYKKAIENIIKCEKAMQALKVPTEIASKAINDYYNGIVNKGNYD